MSAYMLVLDYLLDHGSITTAEAKSELEMESARFRKALSDIKKVLQIKSEVIDVATHARRHMLIREPRACIP